MVQAPVVAYGAPPMGHGAAMGYQAASAMLFVVPGLAADLA